MRTTLDIDDDLLLAARDLAAVEEKSVGKVLSELARTGLQRRPADSLVIRNGFELLPGRSNVVAAGEVDRLLDEEPVAQ